MTDTALIAMPDINKLDKKQLKWLSNENNKALIVDTFNNMGKEGSAIVQKVFEAVASEKVALFILLIVLLQILMNIRVLNKVIGATCQATLTSGIVWSSVLPWE